MRSDDTWSVPARETCGVDDLVRRLGVSPVTAHLLVRMGYQQVEAAKGFLSPSLGELLDPAGFPHMKAAVDRLQQAIDAGERVLLFGDYDVDGSTGAAILFEVLGALGAAVEAHIPDRGEGYGLNRPRLERAAADGVRVVVSIDNGIAALEEAAYLREQGLDLIVCDHHTFAPELPAALALIHPRLPGAEYPNPHLCGAGVAFKLAWAVALRYGSDGKASPRLREVLVQCMGLVALGTVADVVPLQGENRILVRHGLRVLAKHSRPGVQELLRTARIEGAPDATDVAFRLAPRLNAAGRMGSARRAFELLTTTDAEVARRLAAELDQENERRRTVQKRVYEEAHAQVLEVYGEQVREAGIVVWGEGWPHGVVGIVAAKLTETFRRPALVASLEGDRAKGSGRSVEDVDLLASLEPHRALFARMGGHAAAVGFTIDPARLPDLRAAFSQGVRASLGLGPDACERELAAALDGYAVQADVEVHLDELSRELLDELERMSPFGAGNPEPVFAARGLVLAGEPQLMGKRGEHVSFLLRQGERVLRTVAFGRPDLWELLREKAMRGPGGARPLEVAFKPRLNRWNGQAKVELELTALRLLDA